MTQAQPIAPPAQALAAEPPPAWSEARFAALAAGLAAATFALIWYQSYGLNQAIQLAYVNHWLDPSLYRRDPFLSTAPYYATLFWPAVAAAARVVPLQGVLLAGMIVERFISIFAAGRIARSLVVPSPLPRLAAMIIMTVGPLPLLGAGTTMPDYFEQSGLAIAVLLVAIDCLLNQRYVLWGVLIGFSANLNALYAAYAVIYSAAIFFACRRPLSEMRRVAIAIVPMVLAAIPMLVLLKHLPPQRPFDEALWWRAMMFRSAHHLLPLSWPRPRFVEFGLCMALLLAIAWLARPRRMRPDLFGVPAAPTLTGFAVAVAVTSIAAVGAAFAVAYVIRVPRLLTLQPIRATDLGYCLTDIAFAAFAARWFENHSSRSTSASVVAVTVLLLACVWPLLPIAALLIAVGCGIAVYVVAANRQATPSARRRGAICACLAAVLAAVIARPALTWNYTQFNTGNRWPISGAAAWAARATPKDSVFLLDALDDRTEPFRALSRRGIFVHVKDGTALFCDADYLTTWRTRMQQAGYPLPDQPATGPEYTRWRDAQARQLHASAGVDYWLTTPEWPTQLPVVWQDRNFKVLNLNTPAPPQQSPPARPALPPRH